MRPTTDRFLGGPLTDLVHFLLALSGLSVVWVFARYASRALANELEWEAVLDPRLRVAPANDNAPAPHDAPTEPGTTLPAYEPTRAPARRRRKAS